nr:MBL fold metallo-hydrolase [Paenibacillus arenosi]
MYQTTSTVIQTKDIVLLVDPNWLPNEIEEIKHFLDTIKGERDTYLLFTHGDFDHIIGYQAFPAAKVISSSALANSSEKEQRLEMIREFDNKHYISRNYPIAFPKVDVMINEDGQRVCVGDTTLTFYLAPGHTEDGLFTVIEPLGVMIAGDYLSNFELPFIYQSAKAYKQTMEKAYHIFTNHKIQLLVPGHGQATTDSTEMKRRLDVAANYLERLCQAVMADDEQALDSLYNEHAFLSSFTKYCHEENIAIIKREYT